uniref:Uncharacterized protein n=1 Tax=Trichogramma kaykai TaxID=54128 RepID=A0ABD2XH13_9HYME
MNELQTNYLVLIMYKRRVGDEKENIFLAALTSKCSCCALCTTCTNELPRYFLFSAYAQTSARTHTRTHVHQKYGKV